MSELRCIGRARRAAHRWVPTATARVLCGQVGRGVAGWIQFRRSLAVVWLLGSLLGVAVTAHSITTHPSNYDGVVGQAATFSVSASGTGNVSYQWEHNGLPFSGATDATLAIPSVGRAAVGRYAVTVSDSTGQARSIEAGRS